LRRNLPSIFIATNNESQLLNLQNRFYSLNFSNKNKSYQNRSIKHIFHPKEQSGNVEQGFPSDYPWKQSNQELDFTSFSKTIIENLVENPNSLFQQANFLRKICEEEGITIPNIATFDGIQTWEEFMELLSSFSSKKDPQFFELTIALIVQYADLCEK